MTVYIITKLRDSIFSHSESKVGGEVLKVKVLRCENNKNTEITDIIDIYDIFIIYIYINIQNLFLPRTVNVRFEISRKYVIQGVCSYQKSVIPNQVNSSFQITICGVNERKMTLEIKVSYYSVKAKFHKLKIIVSL